MAAVHSIDANRVRLAKKSGPENLSGRLVPSRDIDEARKSPHGVAGSHLTPVIHARMCADVALAEAYCQGMIRVLRVRAQSQRVSKLPL